MNKVFIQLINVLNLIVNQSNRKKKFQNHFQISSFQNLTSLSINQRTFLPTKMSTKSTNVRQLMNLLSQKYFGNQLNYTSNKPQTPVPKTYLNKQDKNISILSPVSSCKTSPKFNRLSCSQGKQLGNRVKQNQNFNYFEQTKNYFDQTRTKFKKPIDSSLKTYQRKKLELRDINGSCAIPYVIGNQSGSEMQQSQSGLYASSYSRKTSQKIIVRNNSNTLLNPVTFTSINPSQNFNTNNSRVVKESIAQSKGTAKRLFLKQNSSSVHKMESNSTISNSRGSVNTRKDNFVSENNPINKRDEKFLRNQQTLKEQIQFYRSKCSMLEQENSELREKVTTYEEQFSQEKKLVQNLKNIVSKREEQINQIIRNRLAGHQKKEQLLLSLTAENQTLRNQLEEVREVLKQQESIIMQLYAQHKQKSVYRTNGFEQQRTKSISKTNPNNIGSFKSQNQSNLQKIKLKNTINGSNSIANTSSLNNDPTNGKSYAFRYPDQNCRQSITQTSYQQEDELKIAS